LVLLVLLYLLVGVRLTLRFERRALEPVLNAAVHEMGTRAWVLLDAGGVVLHLGGAGERGLGHSAAVLVGQRFADLVPLSDMDARVALREMLRVAALGHTWTGELPILDEAGMLRRVRLRALPFVEVEVRRAGLIALGPQAGEGVSA
jgi:hypothetical protein